MELTTSPSSSQPRFSGLIIVIFILLILTSCSGGGGGGRGDNDAPVTQLLAPLGGEVFRGEVLVQWQTTDANPNVVEIAVSSDSGLTFNVIETAVTDNGEYRWDTINNPPTPEEGGNYRIRVIATDIPGNAGNEQISSNDFAIDFNVPVTTFTPLVSDFVSGTDIIQWDTVENNKDTVEIRISDDGGVTFPTVLAQDIEDDGSFDWDSTAFADGNQYKLQIIATDEAGNNSLADIYPENSAENITIDNTPPTLSNALLTPSLITPDTMTINWSKADDNLTDPVELTYQLFRSTTNNINSVDNITNNGTAAIDQDIDINIGNANGLTSATRLFWNVLVEDLAGNQTAYSTLDQGTSANGSPDTTFNGTGLLNDHDAAGGDGDDRGHDVAIDNNGNIVVVGRSVGATLDAAFWRFDSSGIPDTGFNGTGIVTSNNAAGGNNADRANALFIDSNNRVVATGASSGASNLDMVVWRFLETGSPDTTFDTAQNDGIVVHTSASGNDEGFDVVVDDQNNILVAGKIHNGSNEDMAVWRFTSNGTPDTSFGTNGLVTHAGIVGKTNSNDVALSMALKPTGNQLNPYHVFVTGSSGNNTARDMVVWRFDANGDVVAGDNNGIFAISPAGTFGSLDDFGSSIKINGDGNIVVAGLRFDTVNRNVVIWQFTGDGNLDTNLNSSGFKIDNFLNSSFEVIGPGMVIDAAGNIIVAGQVINGAELEDMVIWQFKPNGDNDTNFDSNGRAIGAGIIPTADETGSGITLDSNGKIIVTGYADNAGANQDMMLWRFE